MPRRSTIRQIVLALGAAATVVATASLVRPIYVSQRPVARELLAAPDTVHPLPMWLRLDGEVATLTPQFQADRAAFARDLLRTGKVTPERADSLADWAVREAYKRRVPPALVLGVMLTENDELRSSARSPVGAVGLMQINPREWRHALGRLFGTDVRSDSTNVRYGVFILGHLLKRTPDTADVQTAWRTALLRYNGCVRGRNTPDCHRYPDRVRRQVERSARATCAARSFEQCVAEPLWLSFRTAVERRIAER